MKYPILNSLNASRQTLDVFKGYNHQLRIGDGEFYDMKNLTSDHYPLLAPRRKRGKVILNPSFTGSQMIAKNLLWYQWGSYLQGYNPDTGAGHTFTDADLGNETKLISFGSYIVDMGEKRWFSTVPNENGAYETGSFAYTLTSASNVFDVYLCDKEGSPIEVGHFGADAPPETSGGILWYDTTAVPGVLKRYYEYNKGWFEEPTYLRISMNIDASEIEIGDYIHITAPYLSVQSGDTVHETKIVDADQAKEVILTGTNTNGNGYVVIKGNLTNAVGYSIASGKGTIDQSSQKITANVIINGEEYAISSQIPVMDFVVESGNRLWGCRYGANNNGEFVNEIYASKLGSFRVWEKFEGVSDDSYMVSCGTDGPFTGAISYGGYPIFFKENHMHRVYGTYPFQVTPTSCNGVQAGCDRSLSVVNNILFYKSPTGICTYSGSMPQLLELPFGGINYTSCIAAGTHTKYYFSMVTDQKRVLFVYDTKTGLLHKEDSLPIEEMCSYGTEVYALISAVQDNLYQRGIVCLTNRNTANPNFEDKVEWFAETGMIGLSLPNKKYVTSLHIRMSLSLESSVSLYARYDSKGDFEHLYTTTATSINTFTVPVRVKRCDHLQLRISGKGDAKIYSITKTIEQGSDR